MCDPRPFRVPCPDEQDQLIADVQAHRPRLLSERERECIRVARRWMTIEQANGSAAIDCAVFSILSGDSALAMDLGSQAASDEVDERAEAA